EQRPRSFVRRPLIAAWGALLSGKTMTTPELGASASDGSRPLENGSSRARQARAWLERTLTELRRRRGDSGGSVLGGLGRGADARSCGSIAACPSLGRRLR